MRKFALCMLNILGMLMLRNISQSILCSFALVMYDFVRWQHFITALSMLFMSQLTWICTVHTGKDRFCLFNMSYHRHKMSSMQCFIPKKRMAHKIVFGCAACLANTKPCCNLIGEPCSFELNFIHQNRIVLSHSRQIGPISVLRIRFYSSFLLFVHAFHVRYPMSKRRIEECKRITDNVTTHIVF